MTYVLHNLLNKIPDTKNANLRKAAAKAFQKEMDDRKYPLGRSCSEYLLSFVNNGVPPTAAQQEGEVVVKIPNTAAP